MLSEFLTSWRRRHAASLRRAGVIAPLTLLSASWTLSVAGVGGPAAPLAAKVSDAPPAVSVPTTPVEVPASVTAGHAVRPNTSRVVRTVSTAGSIPATALAAYQRADAIIEGADGSCHLTWPLLAAIGRIESDHGRYGGSVLDANGKARPAIVGIALDGRRGTTVVSDSDGGRYDGDERFDRAVGPMQFIPTTWGVVGVDADADGVRDPQDVDDAALAAAVYLCSGDEDLAEPRGLRDAVLRYNHSEAYADQVLAIARTYSAVGVQPLAAGLVVQPEGATTARAEPVPAARGGEGQDIHAAAQPQPVRQPSPKPDGQKPSEGANGSTTELPNPKPTATPLAPLVETLECTLSGLGKLLQPGALPTCLSKLGR